MVDFRGWAYILDNGVLGNLCILLERDPSRVVITRDEGLRASIRAECGITDPAVILIK